MNQKISYLSSNDSAILAQSHLNNIASFTTSPRNFTAQTDTLQVFANNKNALSRAQKAASKKAIAQHNSVNLQNLLVKPQQSLQHRTPDYALQVAASANESDSFLLGGKRLSSNLPVGKSAYKQSSTKKSERAKKISNS